MLESYLPNLNGLPAPLPTPHPLLGQNRGVAHHYQLVALQLEGSGGQSRPVLGSRWHLPVYEQWRRQPELGLAEARLVRPFVLRAALGETIEMEVCNLLPLTPLCLALVDDEYHIWDPAGAREILPGETQTYVWRCCHAGIYPIYNRACADVVERRNLLGVLIVEP